MGIVSAIGLYILVSVFSSGTESNARWKILIIAIGAAVVQGVILALLPNLVGLLLGMVVSVGLIAAALMLWCGVERKPVFKIAGSYFGLCLVLTVATSFLSR
jgi:hypothetical protein